MNRPFTIVLTLSVWLLLLETASAQLWSGILDRSRAADWTQTGVNGGIPNRTTQCGTTIAAYGTSGIPASADIINTAIINCHNAGGGVVLLGSGDFYLSDSITFALDGTNTSNSAQNVTLRGAGANLTILHFRGSGNGWCNLGGLICVASASSASAQCGHSVSPNQASWTAGYAAGTTQITLSSIAGNGNMPRPLTAGMYLTLDQTNSPDSDANLYVPFATSSTTYSPAGSCDVGNGVSRCVAEYHKVVSITGSGPYTVTISPGVTYQAWSSAKSPRAWWCEDVNQRPLNDGVENLTAIDEISSPQCGGACYGIVQFSGAAQSWMKGVRQINGRQAHVFIYDSTNIEIRDSYFYGIYNPTGCGVAATQYGIDPAVAGWVRVENNIFQQTCSAMMAQPCFVCAFGYNYTVGDLPQILGGISFVFWSFEPGHVGGTHNILFEGNEVNALNVDHGTSHGTNPMTMAVFRNKMTGTGPSQSPRSPFFVQGYNRFVSAIGNVVGDPSLPVGWGYRSNPPSTGTSAYGGTSAYLFGIGWSNNGAPNDTITSTSFMAWGNFDYKTNAVRWCGDSSSPGWSTICQSVTEIPAGNAVPTSTALPASFYIASKPGWFGSVSWPTIGPDVTGGTDVSGHAGNIPAKNCYLNVMKGPTNGSGSVLTFNAASCYGSTSDQTPPKAPTGLSVS